MTILERLKDSKNAREAPHAPTCKCQGSGRLPKGQFICGYKNGAPVGQFATGYEECTG